MRAPTLRKLLLATFSSGAAVALAVMLVVAVGTADRLSSRAAAIDLLNSLKDGVVFTPGSGVGPGGMAGAGYGMRRARGQGGSTAVSADAMSGYAATWAPAAAILRRGEGFGYGRVPFATVPVVWAALAQTGGGYRIAWTHRSAVREAAGGTLLLVGAAVILSFALAGLAADAAARRISRAVGQAADASRRMAEGDFSERLESHNIRELLDLADAVNYLAASLDTTLTRLKAQNTELARLERAQRDFVADASHELRAPLTSVAITLDAAADGLLSEEEKSQSWTLLRAEVRRLSRIVSELLDLSRIESGRESIKIEHIDVGEVVARVHRWYASLPDRLPSMSVTLPQAESIMAAGDADALHRCLVNFVDNAIKATPIDGQITIWARRGSDGGIGGGDGGGGGGGGGGGDHGTILVGVTDTGAGMTDDELARAFERFARSDVARGAGREGSGLGLSIVRALARAMGGDVGITSRQGEGTSAWVCLKSIV